MSEPKTTLVAGAISGPDPGATGTLIDAKPFLASLPPRPGASRPPRIVNRIAWQDEVEERVNAGGSVEISFDVAGPAGLIAHASWFGSETPPRLVATLDGATLTEGVATRAPPDAGGSTMRTTTDTAGTVRVSVEHTGNGAATIRLLVGVAVF